MSHLFSTRGLFHSEEARSHVLPVVKCQKCLLVMWPLICFSLLLPRLIREGFFFKVRQPPWNELFHYHVNFIAQTFISLTFWFLWVFKHSFSFTLICVLTIDSLLTKCHRMTFNRHCNNILMKISMRKIALTCVFLLVQSAVVLLLIPFCDCNVQT